MYQFASQSDQTRSELDASQAQAAPADQQQRKHRGLSLPAKSPPRDMHASAQVQAARDVQQQVNQSPRLVAKAKLAAVAGRSIAWRKRNSNGIDVSAGRGTIQRMARVVSDDIWSKMTDFDSSGTSRQAIHDNGREVIQLVKVPLPKTVKLTGGTGVSVVKKFGNGGHVSVTYRGIDARKQTVEITGFHYTKSDGSHIFWNRNSGGTSFAVSSDSGRSFPQGTDFARFVTDHIFNETNKVARKFGCSLIDPRPPTEDPAAETGTAETAATVPAAATVASSANSDTVADSWEDLDV